MYKSKAYSLARSYLASYQFYACTRPDTDHVKNVHDLCLKKKKKNHQLSYLLRTSDTSKFQDILNWWNWMAKCWHSSECNWETAPNVSLQSAGRFVSTEKTAKNCQISTMAVVHKISELTLHYTLSEIAVHLQVTKIWRFTVLNSRSCIIVWLKYIQIGRQERRQKVGTDA